MSTYSLSEIKYLLRKLEVEEIKLLQQVLLDEADCFTPKEISVIHKMIDLRMRFLAVRNLRGPVSESLN
jgi:hypothetical protein